MKKNINYIKIKCQKMKNKTNKFLKFHNQKIKI